MTRSPLPRPALLPGLARLWRDRHTLQLGHDPARAVLLEVADPRLVRLLDLLDGAHTERAILEHATTLQLSRDDARTLLDTLHAAGLVVGAHTLLPGNLPEPIRRRLAAEAAAIALRRGDAPVTPAQILRRRAAARVVLAGHGRLAAPVAVTLAQAGIGHVSPELTGRVTAADTVGTWLTATDVHRPRREAVAEAIVRAAPGTETRPVRRGRGSLTVQLGADRPAALLAAAYARQAHLLVEVRDGTPVVGPLVRPAGSPCLNCLDLHRRDRDPAWPTLAAQLAGDPAAEPCAAPTLIAAAGYAAAEILAYVDGAAPETLGAAVEISAPGRLRRRSWPPHPGCGCARRRRRSAGPDTRGGSHGRRGVGDPDSR
ncbi:bacteriocin biosynthesis cyclodehydratase domain-containing protein [Micromonospora pattaloongensis]|uniref:Bacteriocin biosynthesis cyclodehydratase domain-containing protein n=1 Tax=Micromonospora pattaloongensis TaxID=405436 RepID=A0A1H3G3B5_9ACTN|nr:ThiF family adenylyltransferase [Micromonospora pattaloongensis]SDX97600.1 bacteriocin biosynthesis cyclodehydratase domain-containing protein [Micromonospora pattaloongensis]